MNDSPWNGVDQRYHLGMRLEGQVSATTPYGAYVEIEPGVEGLVPVDSDGLADAAFDVDDEVELVVLEIDEGQRLLRFGVAV